LSSAPDAAQDASVEELERAGHPVVRIAVDDPYDLGEEFFRWEFATAVAGSILGIHPFDQPDGSPTNTKKRSAAPGGAHLGIQLFTTRRMRPH